MQTTSNSYLTPIIRLVLIVFVLTTSCKLFAPGRPAVNEVTLSRNTVILNGESLNALESVSDDLSTLYFAEPAPQVEDLNPGDIIVAGTTDAAPGGLLRKVTSLYHAKNQIIVNTELAMLEEAIQDGFIRFNRTLTPNDIQDTSQIEGVSIQKAREIVVKIEDLVVFDGDDRDETNYDQVVANGEITIAPSIDIEILIKDNKLESLNWNLTGNNITYILISSNDRLDDISIDHDLASYKFQPVTILAGDFPVVFTPVMLVRFALNGFTTDGLEAGLSQSANFAGALQYEGGQVKPSSEFSNRFQANASPLGEQAQFELFLGPELSVQLYSEMGPNAKVSGYMTGEAEEDREPCWEIFGGFEVGMGLQADNLGTARMDGELSVIDQRKSLFRAGDTCSAPGITNTPQPEGFSSTEVSMLSTGVVQTRTAAGQPGPGTPLPPGATSAFTSGTRTPLSGDPIFGQGTTLPPTNTSVLVTRTRSGNTGTPGTTGTQTLTPPTPTPTSTPTPTPTLEPITCNWGSEIIGEWRRSVFSSTSPTRYLYIEGNRTFEDIIGPGGPSDIIRMGIYNCVDRYEGEELFEDIEFVYDDDGSQAVAEIYFDVSANNVNHMFLEFLESGEILDFIKMD